MMLDIINVKYFYLKVIHIVLFYVERATIAPFTYILTILEIVLNIFIGIVFIYIVWTIYFYVYSYTKDIQKNTSEVKLELSLFFIFVIFISIIYYWDFKIFDYFTIFDNTIFDNKIALADSQSESNTPNLNIEKPKPTTSDLLKYGWTSGLVAGIFAVLVSVVGTSLGYQLEPKDISDVSFIVFNGHYTCSMWKNHGWYYGVGSCLVISGGHIAFRSLWTFPGNPPGTFPGNSPETFPGNPPGNSPGTFPGNPPGNSPGTFPGNPSGTFSGNPPGNSCGTNLQQWLDKNPGHLLKELKPLPAHADALSLDDNASTSSSDAYASSGDSSSADNPWQAALDLAPSSSNVESLILNLKKASKNLTSYWNYVHKFDIEADEAVLDNLDAEWNEAWDAVVEAKESVDVDLISIVAYERALDVATAVITQL